MADSAPGGAYPEHALNVGAGGAAALVRMDLDGRSDPWHGDFCGQHCCDGPGLDRVARLARADRSRRHWLDRRRRHPDRGFATPAADSVCAGHWRPAEHWRGAQYGWPQAPGFAGRGGGARQMGDSVGDGAGRPHSLAGTFTLAVLVSAVGIAVGSAKIFGVSMALGAFLAGLAVGRSEFATRAANDALPMRDAFAVLFFVSVGMLFDPKSLMNVPLIIGLVLLVVVVVKPLAATLNVRLLGEPWATAIPIGAAFSQVGEFSFILGTVALSLGLIYNAGWNALVAASIVSIGLNPYLYTGRVAGRRREVGSTWHGTPQATGPLTRIAVFWLASAPWGKSCISCSSSAMQRYR